MSAEASDPGEREQRLDEAIAAYFEQVDSGRTTTDEEWIARYPEFRKELREFFEDRRHVDRFASPLRCAIQPSRSLECNQHLGDYLIHRQIGRGGMGIVYEAEQMSLRRRVALKVLPFAAVLDDRQRKRFQNEAQAAALLRHPNIVGVLAVGCDRGVHYYAMDLIQGQSLAEVIPQARHGEVKATDHKAGEDPERDTKHGEFDSSHFATDKRKPAVAALTATVLTLLAFFAIAGPLVAWRERSLAQQQLRLLYSSDVSSAYDAWDESNLSRALTLLARHPPELRDFAWHYLWTQLEKAATTPQLKHDSAVISVAVSPSGNILAAGCDDGTVNLWDLHLTRRRLITALRGHTELVSSVAFSPDEEILAVASEDCSITLWNVITAECLATLRGHAKWLTSVAFSPSGDTLASASADETVKLWDVATRKVRMTLEGHAGSVNAVSFSPDGRTLASGGNDAKVRLWDVESGGLRDTLSNRNFVFAVAFSPDGKSLASGGYNYEIKLWDAQSAAELASLRIPEHSITSLAYSPDSQLLASGGFDNTARLWETASGEAVAVIKGHSANVSSVDFSPDGRTLATGGEDGSVRLWEVGAYLPEPSDRVTGVFATPIVFLPNGRMLAAATGIYDKQSTFQSGDIRMFDLKTGQRRTLDGHGSSIISIAISRRYLATGVFFHVASGGPEIQLWDVSTGRRMSELEKRIDLQWSRGSVCSVTFSPDGKRLAVGGGETPGPGEIKLWDLTTGKPLGKLEGDTGRVLHLAFSPDGQMLAASGNTWRGINLTLWDLKAGRRLRVLRGHVQRARAYGSGGVAFSPDGKILASGGHDGSVKLWDVASGSVRRNLTGHSRRLLSVAFSPDGKTLASIAGYRVKLWYVATGEELATFRLPLGVVSVAFSPDGKTLAAGINDRSITLWHAATERQDWPVSLR